MPQKYAMIPQNLLVYNMHSLWPEKAVSYFLFTLLGFISVLLGFFLSLFVCFFVVFGCVLFCFLFCIFFFLLCNVPMGIPSLESSKVNERSIAHITSNGSH